MNRLTYILLALLSFIVIILRVFYVPINHDEIATFYYYIQPFEYNPLSGAHGDANNHILNSFLSGLIYKNWGYSVFNIRVVNMLSFIPYAIFVFLIGKQLKQKLTQSIFYLALITPIFFLHFFSLSRGYGMSMAFLLGGLYFALQLYHKKSNTNIVALSICLILAIYSNMSLLPLSLLTFFFALIQLFIRFKEYRNWKSLLSIFLSVTFSLYAIYKAVIISFKMKEEGALYYGGLDSFWVSTIKSQLKLLFENEGNLIQIALIFVLVLFAIVMTLRFRIELKEKSKNILATIINAEFFFFYLMAGVFIGVIIMAKLLEINYPEDRVGMYFYLLFVGAFCFAVDKMEKSKMRFSILIFLIIPIHTLFAFNINRSSIWNTGFFPDRFYDTITNTPSQSKYPTSVAGDALRTFVYAEKVLREGKNNNMLQCWPKTMLDTATLLMKNGKNHPGEYCDYLITNKPFIKEIAHLYDSIDVARMSKLALFKRKEPSIKTFITKEEKHTNSQINNEFFEFYKSNYDSIGVDALMVGVDLEVQALKHPFEARLVAQVKDVASGEILDYQFFQFDWVSQKVVKEKPYINSLYLTNVPKNKEFEVLVYLWNINKMPYSIYKGEVELFKVQ